MAGLSHCMQFLRQHAPEHYLVCLYLPPELREDVASLWAFDAEINRIPDLVSEPLPGEIRMQWWRDLLQPDGTTEGAPLAQALLATISKNDLPREKLHTYLEARTFDLYQDPMPDMNTLEGYLGETRSMMYYLAALCVNGDVDTQLADACGHAGVAMGLVRILMHSAASRHRQQMYVPVDLVKQRGLDRNTWLLDAPSDKHLEVANEVANRARDHLDQARKSIALLPKTQQRIFRNLALVPPGLRKIDAAGISLFNSVITFSPLERFWHLLRGRY